MFVKMITIVMVVFLESFIFSESVKIENEIQITELVKKIVVEKTSELSNKVRSLENIVVNQQRRIDRLEKQEKRKERTITYILKIITDIQHKIKAKSLEVFVESDDTDNSNMDRHRGSEVMTKLNITNGPENEVSSVRPANHMGISRRRRQTKVVAFSVYLSHSIDHMSVGHHIVFDKALTNDGEGYNIHTGIFTTPVTGLYLFTFSFSDGLRISAIQLVVDGTNMVDIVDSPVNNKESMSSNTVILHVNKGQSVWLQDYLTQDGSIVSGEIWRYCTFSGVLLY